MKPIQSRDFQNILVIRNLTKLILFLNFELLFITLNFIKIKYNTLKFENSKIKIV